MILGLFVPTFHPDDEKPLRTLTRRLTARLPRRRRADCQHVEGHARPIIAGRYLCPAPAKSRYGVVTLTGGRCCGSPLPCEAHNVTDRHTAMLIYGSALFQPNPGEQL